jgi:hypothetical protein
LLKLFSPMPESGASRGDAINQNPASSQFDL